MATLLKSTEPYIEQYFALDMEAALKAAGFHDLQIAACDPRHRVIACRRPKTLTAKRLATGAAARPWTPHHANVQLYP